MSAAVHSLPPDLPAWLPSGGVQTLPCGRWWDTVRTSSFNGILAIGHMGGRTGPIIEDQTSRTFHWLVPVDSAAGWSLPHVDVLGAGCTLRVPPAAWIEGPAVHWEVPVPASGNVLTDPAALHDALHRSLHGLQFREPVRALRRCSCGELVIDGEAHTCGEPEPGR